MFFFCKSVAWYFLSKLQICRTLKMRFLSIWVMKNIASENPVSSLEIYYGLFGFYFEE